MLYARLLANRTNHNFDCQQWLLTDNQLKVQFVDFFPNN